MENFLRFKEFWGLVEPGYVEPTSGSLQTDAQRKKNDEMKLKDLKYKCPFGNKEADYAELDKEDEMLMMSYVELYENIREDAWFLDSRYECDGKESVKLLLNRINHVVVEVYYIPELRNNLLSIGQLQERGLGIVITGEMCKIFHPEKGLIIQTNMSANKMFILHTQSSAPFQAQCDHCFHTKAQNLSHLWHRRCPPLAVKDVTPNEAWSGVKPSVDYFWVFGCIAHVHIPEARRTKLDSRSITYVLLGVNEESKGYRLFDPIAKRVVMIDLEWGESYGENEKGMSENENGDDTDEEVRETSDERVREEEDGSSEREERVRELRQPYERQPLTWMGSSEYYKLEIGHGQ
ncbi:hypothetical protein JRO89_XS13G0163300 [Xanthoceras sorbifolium]|uniref:Uncharacterized protein n=1 Tax=Xanthoceras sorbifolium TaxID=99658 RepID=A0ABQ8H8N5_9ROSI|nr:hypothetical protein JRO89_XS13G0163300 [Xanthoceras sorbifolium]